MSGIKSSVWIDECDVNDVLRRVREVDSDCTRDEVRRYVQEIAEAARTLDLIPLEDDGFATSFTPAWPMTEEQR